MCSGVGVTGSQGFGLVVFIMTCKLVQKNSDPPLLFATCGVIAFWCYGALYDDAVDGDSLQGLDDRIAVIEA